MKNKPGLLWLALSFCILTCALAIPIEKTRQESLRVDLSVTFSPSVSLVFLAPDCHKTCRRLLSCRSAVFYWNWLRNFKVIRGLRELPALQFGHKELLSLRQQASPCLSHSATHKSTSINSTHSACGISKERKERCYIHKVLTFSQLKPVTPAQW